MSRPSPEQPLCTVSGSSAQLCQPEWHGCRVLLSHTSRFSPWIGFPTPLYLPWARRGWTLRGCWWGRGRAACRRVLHRGKLSSPCCKAENLPCSLSPETGVWCWMFLHCVCELRPCPLSGNVADRIHLGETTTSEYVIYFSCQTRKRERKRQKRAEIVSPWVPVAGWQISHH